MVWKPSRASFAPKAAPTPKMKGTGGGARDGAFQLDELPLTRIAATGQEMTHLPIAWSILHYLIASGFALGSAAVAGYLPARRAARVNPVDIIRGAT